MSTRIRYQKQTDGTLVSKSFKTPNEELVVNIKPSFLVTINTLSGEEKHSEDGKTLTGAKKAAKNALKGLGVVFQDEVRPRIKQNSVYDLIETVKKQNESENHGE